MAGGNGSFCRSCGRHRLEHIDDLTGNVSCAGDFGDRYVPPLMPDDQKLRATVAATVFAGMAGNERIFNEYMERQIEGGNGTWSQGMAELAVNIARDIIRRSENP